MYIIETNTEFSQFGLNKDLLASLDARGFKSASPIQELTIPSILSGKDIFAQAETGSGKTGSFAIPILEKILRNEDKEKFYIVLSPTRELAQQTYKVFTEFGEPLDIKAACVIGGESFDKQLDQLEQKPQIIVGTPGRFCDLMKRKVFDIEKCCCVVFDEADRLFEMGFQKDIELVLNGVNLNRQLIMVSATSNQEVMTTAYKFHSHPEELKLNEDDLLVDNINHEIAMISEKEKMPYLVHLLRKQPDAYGIVFCNTQYMTHLVAIWLKQMDFKAMPISGRLPQNKRTRLMEDFRSRKISILVCTDVAARGLDIKDVNLVVNYDLPQEASNYVHRIGRTGRAGKEGLAVSFCAFSDCENLDDISEYIGVKIPKSDIEDENFEEKISPRPRIDPKTLKLIERKTEVAKKASSIRNENSKVNKAKENNPLKMKESRQTTMRERSIKLTCNGEAQAVKQALKHFGIEDSELLDIKVLEQGRKKFFLFGARISTYQVEVKAIYKKLLQPFLIELFKKMNLKIFVRVSFYSPNVKIVFSGKDAGALIKNKYELQNAVEEIALKYLWRKINIPRNVNITLRTEKKDEKKNQEKELVALAQRIVEKVELENKPVLSKTLNPAERRIIHQFVNENTKFESKSIGEGRFKQVEISLK